MRNMKRMKRIKIPIVNTVLNAAGMAMALMTECNAIGLIAMVHRAHSVTIACAMRCRSGRQVRKRTMQLLSQSQQIRQTLMDRVTCAATMRVNCYFV